MGFHEFDWFEYIIKLNLNPSGYGKKQIIIFF